MERKEWWAKSYRKLHRNNNTNNFAEASMKTLKVILFNYLF